MSGEWHCTGCDAWNTIRVGSCTSCGKTRVLKAQSGPAPPVQERSANVIDMVLPSKRRFVRFRETGPIGTPPRDDGYDAFLKDREEKP